MASPTIYPLGTIYLSFATFFSLMAVPFLCRKIPRNYFYGYRWGPAMRSTEAWYAINEYAARRILYYCGVLFGVGVVLLLFSHYVVDFQTKEDSLWPLVGFVPAFYCLLRPVWETNRWAKHRYYA